MCEDVHHLVRRECKRDTRPLSFLLSDEMDRVTLSLLEYHCANSILDFCFLDDSSS
jgi:hypothetical protein